MPGQSCFPVIRRCCTQRVWRLIYAWLLSRSVPDAIDDNLTVRSSNRLPSLN